MPYAASADLLLALVALEGEGTSLVIIDPISEALSVERERTFGGEPLYRVKFHSVVITSDDVVSTPGRGGEALERAIQHYTVLQLAYLTGLSEGALQICLSHVRERQQFGRSIGSFQAVAHRCVDMQTDIDAMRILTLQAAWELGRSGRNRPSVSVAKAYGNGAARRIFTNAHQVTAAMGFSMEFDLQLFTRRAKAIELNGGATTAHLERVAVAIGLDEDWTDVSSAGADPVLTERIGSALVVTLNRPERLNATNFRMNERLRQIWVDTAADADVRTVILTGAGRGFCVGADATEVLGTRTATDVSLEEEISFLPGRNLDIPVICAVNGLCVGGGLHFVADSDITIASSNAEFMDPHVNMGQVSGIEPASLAFRVPVTWLTRLALLGRGERISAGRALEIDLVSEVVEPAVLLGRAFRASPRRWQTHHRPPSAERDG